MRAGNPLTPLAAAFYSAKIRDLDDVVSIKNGNEHRSRPNDYDIEVFAMFPQTWGSTALGFGGMGGAAMSTAYTIVLRGPMHDFAVYFGGRLAYKLPFGPSEKFFDDVAAMHLASVSSAQSKYIK